MIRAIQDAAMRGGNSIARVNTIMSLCEDYKAKFEGGNNMQLLEMQAKVLNFMKDDNNDITICATGLGSGKSVAAFMLPLLGKDILLVSKTCKFDEDNCRALYSSMEVDVSYSRSHISLLGVFGGITFMDSLPLFGESRQKTIVIDSPQLFQDDYKELYGKHKLLFLTNPYECGWRHLKYEDGIIQVKEDGSPELEDRSWDCDLVNWNNRLMKTKAVPNDYRDGVNIVTGYGAENNPYLEGNFMGVMNNLPHYELKRLVGKWHNS